MCVVAPNIPLPSAATLFKCALTLLAGAAVLGSFTYVYYYYYYYQRAGAIAKFVLPTPQKNEGLDRASDAATGVQRFLNLFRSATTQRPLAPRPYDASAVK